MALRQAPATNQDQREWHGGLQDTSVMAMFAAGDGRLTVTPSPCGAMQHA